ncbi:MAG: hypothetical protein WCX65_20125 [bacterium]
MSDIRNFRKYLEELTGNDILRRKVKALERSSQKLEAELKEIQADIKLMKNDKTAVVAEKRGRKSRTMLQIIEAEMTGKKIKTMKVKDMVKLLKRKNFESKAKNPYYSVAAALRFSKKFERAGVGEFKLVGEKKAGVKAAKGSGRRKKATGKGKG